MSNGLEFGDGPDVSVGKVYRDLDGSLVHLLGVKRNLCSWVAIGGAPATVQVTHVDNFRRRFRTLETGRATELKNSA